MANFYYASTTSTTVQQWLYVTIILDNTVLALSLLVRDVQLSYFSILIVL